MPGAARPLPSSLAVIAAVWRAHGLGGFWRGQLGTLIRETGGSAAWLGSYEGVCALFRRRRRFQQHSTTAQLTPVNGTHPDDAALPVGQQLLAGAVAGVSYNFVFYPADTIKSRLQTDVPVSVSDGGGGAGGGGARPTFAMVGRTLWREQGLRGLYRGCGITVGRAAPSSAVIFAVYEWLKTSFG